MVLTGAGMSDGTRHYAQSGIAGRLLAALRDAEGADVAITPDALSPMDHFIDRGVRGTADLADLLGPRSGEQILDIGCGIGGPARWIAAHYDCHVTGVDITEAFCEAARELTDATGLHNRVRILHGSGTALPLPDGSFDRALTQAVVMNVEEIDAFYAEAYRVLRAGGMFAGYLVAAGPGGAPVFPLPWAHTEATSFLITPEATRLSLQRAGFEILSLEDLTEQAVAEAAQRQRQIEANGPPRLSVDILVGADAQIRRANRERAMIERRLLSITFLARKP